MIPQKIINFSAPHAVIKDGPHCTITSVLKPATPKRVQITNSMDSTKGSSPSVRKESNFTLKVSQSPKNLSLGKENVPSPVKRPSSELDDFVPRKMPKMDNGHSSVQMVDLLSPVDLDSKGVSKIDVKCGEKDETVSESVDKRLRKLSQEQAQEMKKEFDDIMNMFSPNRTEQKPQPSKQVSNSLYSKI